MNYSIQILDQNDKVVGKLMSATPSDILKYINKGFKVVDTVSGQQLDENVVNQTIGVSDGLISIG